MRGTRHLLFNKEEIAMTVRSPITVILLTLVTLGIYGLIWTVKTKNEMNEKYAAGVPSAWWILVPFIGVLYFQWKWAEGAERVTGVSGISVFLLMALVPLVGIPVMVSKFNAAREALPQARISTALAS